MPNIPTYESRARSLGAVGPRQQIDTNVDAAANRGIARLGQAIESAGAAVFDTVKKARVASTVSDAENELATYVQQIQEGSTDAEGKLIAPADPLQHEKLFTDKVEELKGKYGGLDLFGVGASFEERFNPYADRMGLNVKHRALETAKSGLKAELQVTLDKLGDRYADADEMTRAKIQAEAMDLFNDAKTKGFFTPEEAAQRNVQWRENVTRASVRKLIRDDAPSAIIALSTGQFDSEFDADETQRWIDAAVNESERRMRETESKADRDNQRARQRQNDLEEATAKSLWTLRSKGGLTIEKVIANEKNLSEDDYKQLLETASGKSSGFTDAKIYSELSLEAARGIDIRARATKAYRSGLLERSAYDNLNEKFQSTSPVAAGENWFKRGTKYIHDSLLPNPDEANPFQKEIAARIHDDWIEWSQAHPTAKPSEAREAYERLTQEGRIVQRDQVRLAKPIPRYLVGGIEQPDIESSLKRLEEAKKKGEVDDFEFRRQARLLKEWAMTLDFEEQMNKPKTTTKPKASTKKKGKE